VYREPLIVQRTEGLYCPAGDFFVDPWRPVERAVLTHAHADHARRGHARYLAARAAGQVLRARLGEARIDTLEYGEAVTLGDVRVSLHPAGHVLGSAQVRIERNGEVWVVSGDYKLEADPTCAAFEPVRCHAFITESTFGLPIYRWRAPAELLNDLNSWWAANARDGRASVVFAYALGKAQRILASLDSAIGPIVCHGAIARLNTAYRATGVALPETRRVSDFPQRTALAGAMVLAPPSAQSTPWLRRFPGYSDAFASGWMQLRGARRRRAVDRGFALSDHADWPGLQAAIAASGAETVIVTHGYAQVMVRWLAARGYDARAFDTEFEGEDGASGTPSEAEAEAAAEVAGAG
jgi:putative mRNA 3-end processing factor